jgi:hypothetical protein
LQRTAVDSAARPAAQAVGTAGSDETRTVWIVVRFVSRSDSGCARRFATPAESTAFRGKLAESRGVIGLLIFYSPVLLLDCRESLLSPLKPKKPRPQRSRSTS